MDAVNTPRINSPIFNILYRDNKGLDEFLNNEQAVVENNDRINYKIKEYSELLKYGSFIYKNQEICFNDDKWLLKRDNHQKNTHSINLVFDKTENINIPLKCYVYELLSTKSYSASYVKSKLNHLKLYLNHLKDNYFDLLDYEVTISFLEELSGKDITFESVTNYVNDIKEFLSFLNTSLYVDTFNYNKLDLWLANLKINKSKIQYKLMEFSFYNKLNTLLKNEIRNTDIPLTTRKKDACLLIMSMVGMRVSDAVALTYDCVVYPRKDNPEKPFIKFMVTKKSKHKPFTTFFPISDSLKNEIEYIKENLSGEFGKANNLLFPQTESVKHLLYSGEKIEKELVNFSFKYRNELGLVNNAENEQFFNGLKTYNELKKNYRTLYLQDGIGFKEDDVLYHPTSHQFRVFCISQYFSAGVSLPEIMFMYTHKDASSSYGYYRSVDKDEGSKVGTLELMKTSDELNIQIKSVPTEVNVHKCVDDVLTEADGFVSVANVNGGYCLNLNGDECDDAMPKNFILPAPYMESGILTSDVVDSIEKDIVILKDIIKYNLDNGFEQQSKKEEKKLEMLNRALLKAKNN